jgi:hypothetical protein
VAAEVVASQAADAVPNGVASVQVAAEAAPTGSAAGDGVEESGPAVAAPTPFWNPTHVVPAGGLPAWDAPDPSRPPVAMLSERVELVVVAWAGAWAQVRGVNGWTGWVDGRRIIVV